MKNQYDIMKKNFEQIDFSYNSFVDKYMLEIFSNASGTVYTDTKKWKAMREQDAREKFDGIKRHKPELVSLASCEYCGY